MSDQEFSPDKRIECAEMDLRSSVGPTCCHAVEGADPQCAPSVPALCAAVERANMFQSYAGLCAVEQARELQDYVEFNDGAATAHDGTAGTVFDRKCPAVQWDVAVGIEAQTKLALDPASMSLEPTPCTVHLNERSRSPQRHEEEEPFGLTSVHLSHQFGFRDSTLWCWKCGGWSAGSRRASRLKCPCGAPTRTGADVCIPCLRRSSP